MVGAVRSNFFMAAAVREPVDSFPEHPIEYPTSDELDDGLDLDDAFTLIVVDRLDASTPVV